ncbi:MAG: sigma-70 family RNA polymerase sigma factor [Phycisphaerae bacterium]|nr:sigma-70 family RNA polymerase sigma factor [Tepidisphaeraceae bacterium]
MDATEQLVLQHQDFVRSLARGISKKLPRHVDFEDLVSLGQIGLMSAAKQYEPGRGVAFTTFAYYRIRGSIFDGLRGISGLPPSVRREVSRRAAENEAAESLAESTEGPGADDPEFLAKQVSTAVGRLGSIFLLAKAGEDGGALEPEDTLTAHDAAEAKEAVDLVRKALARLPQEQRELLTMLYFEDKTTTEIATRLGKNKSTISRRHADAVDALRALLNPDGSAAADAPSSARAAKAATTAARAPSVPSSPVGPLSPHAALLRQATPDTANRPPPTG